MDAGPSFDEVFPDLEVTGNLLAALAKDDQEAIDELRESEVDWWNVAWTLALLMRDVRAGQPAAVGLVNDLMGEAGTSAATDA